MKINEFTKSEQLLMLIYHIESQGYVFSLKHYGNIAIDYRIAKDKHGLSTILNNLKIDGYLLNTSDHTWSLNKAGSLYAESCIMDLDNDSWFNRSSNENDEVEQPNNFENEESTMDDNVKSSFENMDKAFDCMKQVFNATFGKPSIDNKLLNEVQTLANNNDAYITYVITHFDSIYNAIKNGSESPNKIIECMNDIYANGINPLINNNNALKKLVSKN